MNPLRALHGYFAISSLVMAEILKVMAVNEEWLTGGGNGLILPPRYALREFYYAMLLTLLSVTVIAYAIKRSPMGYALFAIRDDETAAETYGINSTKYKILAFAISASFAGIAGGCFAWFVTYIDPYSAFDSTLALLMIVSAVFGGIGTVMGPIIGGIPLHPIDGGALGLLPIHIPHNTGSVFSARNALYTKRDNRAIGPNRAAHA